MSRLIGVFCLTMACVYIGAGCATVGDLPETSEVEQMASINASEVISAKAKSVPEAPEAAPVEKEEEIMVIIKTSKGDIKVKLFEEEAPLSVANFLQYVDDGHYNGTIFHRVISGFMIQGGGFTEQMVQKPTKSPVKNEADNGLKNKRGTLAMARTQIVDSATSQFFINVVDNAFLDHKAKNAAGYGYCVFGEVVEGMDVVDAIRAVPTTRVMMFADVPQEPVVITDISRVE